MRVVIGLSYGDNFFSGNVSLKIASAAAAHIPSRGIILNIRIINF